ncbi:MULTISPECIES: hypothetical protein [Nostoc]|uniref:Transposase n=1 Tax=Nostoc paludosum FACHB-159 TaxID=2692908 RepID=A0ABR8KK37_9NOSO|nr:MULTISPECIES: hypothetical protein [Nostoc]MBD2682296.1 hypothetical protein [Nostoc sp. FACHB-857]MBD2738630.1 hypothetical protein [Nostoc paludosum FACHB-159]
MISLADKTCLWLQHIEQLQVRLRSRFSQRQLVWGLRLNRESEHTRAGTVLKIAIAFGCC